MKGGCTSEIFPSCTHTQFLLTSFQSYRCTRGTQPNVHELERISQRYQCVNCIGSYLGVNWPLGHPLMMDLRWPQGGFQAQHALLAPFVSVSPPPYARDQQEVLLPHCQNQSLKCLCWKMKMCHWCCHWTQIDGQSSIAKYPWVMTCRYFFHPGVRNLIVKPWTWLPQLFCDVWVFGMSTRRAKNSSFAFGLFSEQKKSAREKQHSQENIGHSTKNQWLERCTRTRELLRHSKGHIFAKSFERFGGLWANSCTLNQNRRKTLDFQDPQ